MGVTQARASSVSVTTMSDFASLELCTELSELSGWISGEWWCEYQGQTVNMPTKMGECICPAYDLGYLLQKLSPFKHEVKGKQGDMMPVRCYVFVWQETAHQWRAGFKYNLLGNRFDDLFVYADSPEDAACKLCCELIRQGLLK